MRPWYAHRLEAVLIETAYDDFLEATRGRFTVVGSAFVWCASPQLCGVCLWGEQTLSETESILHVLEQYPRQMAERFAIVLDTRRVDRVDPVALARLFRWLVEHREDLAIHLWMQANVIRAGPVGFLLTGLLPVAQWALPYGLFESPREAFHAVGSDDTLCEEVDAIAARLRDEPRVLRQVRELLAARHDLRCDQVSRALGTSQRSLQRLLASHGTSFHAEVVAARVEHAKRRLRSSDDKITTVAREVGISERSLTILFRSSTGATPAEWRRRHRA